jgi:hypothetical protein
MAVLTKEQKARQVLDSLVRSARTTWGPYESSSSFDPVTGKRKEYYVTRHADNKMTCPCPRWINKPKGKPRNICKHIDDVMWKEDYQIEIRGDDIYVKE